MSDESEELRAYRESFRTFLARRVVPSYGGWATIPRELFQVAGRDGFLAMAVPEEFGGPGVENARFGVVLAEEAMRAGAPALALALIGHSDAVAAAIVRDGSEDDRSSWLPRLVAGEALATVVVGDITIDDDRVEGGSQFVVQGVDADLLAVLDGPSAVLVERRSAGVVIEPSPPGIGLASAGLADVTFDGVRGSPLTDGAGSALARDLELGLAVAALAGARAALAITVEYVLDRKAFGQPIASFQNTRHVVAQASADIDAADAFARACISERVDGRLSAARAAALKLHCSDLYGDVVDAGLQLHGGYGYMVEYPISRAYADARFWRLTGGTSERLKDRIADGVLD